MTKKRKFKSRLKEKIGKRIRLIRRMQDLTQELLAEMSGIHPTYVGSIERGEANITIETLELIARALKCHIKELIPD